MLRLPGESPEAKVFDDVLKNIGENVAILTAACQRSLEKQAEVVAVVRSVSQTNRDPHLLFSQVGAKLGLVSEETIRGAFLSVWVAENPEECKIFVDAIDAVLELPDE